MTPRTRIEWLDLDAPADEQRRRLLEMTHSRLLLARAQPDDFVDVATARDLLRDLLENGRIDLERALHQPIVVHESMDVLRLTEELRKSTVPVAVVLDEFGALEGLVTPIDVLEAIAGEFPDADEPAVSAERAEDGSWLADGGIDIHQASQLIGVDLVDEGGRYATLGGFVFTQLGRLPSAGERVLAAGLSIEVTEMDGRNIARLRISRVEEEDVADRS